MEKNILIIDDSESIREVVCTELKGFGFHTTQAQNGQEGLLKLSKEDNIRLIITDLNMPVMDGISFLKKVREMEKFRFVPILILTTESQQDKKIEAKRAGATGWIIKPFEREKLISTVNKVMR